VLGRTLHVGQVTATIIGVAPPDFTGTSDQGVPAVYLPISAYAFAARGDRYPTLRSGAGSSYSRDVARSEHYRS